MSSAKERHLLDAMHHLVLYAGGTVSKQVKSIKNVVYQGKTTKRHKPSQYRKSPDNGAAIFRMVSSNTPVTNYGRAKTMMAG